MTLKTIRIELARDTDAAEGNPNDAYEFLAPVTDSDMLDVEGWKEAEQLCTIRRYRPDGEVLHGQVIKTEAGDWAFSYEAGEDDDEHIYRFESHVFRPGEYVTVTRTDETEHVYRVVSVDRPAEFR